MRGMPSPTTSLSKGLASERVNTKEMFDTVDDGYGGLLGWIWLACAITTIGLLAMTWFALKERYYSAVMAATGLLYLAVVALLFGEFFSKFLLFAVSIPL